MPIHVGHPMFSIPQYFRLDLFLPDQRHTNLWANGEWNHSVHSSDQDCRESISAVLLNEPANPGRQMHLYPRKKGCRFVLELLSTQVPLFTHGDDAHSFTSISHKVPEKKTFWCVSAFHFWTVPGKCRNQKLLSVAKSQLLGAWTAETNLQIQPDSRRQNSALVCWCCGNILHRSGICWLGTCPLDFRNWRLCSVRCRRTCRCCVPVYFQRKQMFFMSGNFPSIDPRGNWEWSETRISNCSHRNTGSMTSTGVSLTVVVKFAELSMSASLAITGVSQLVDNHAHWAPLTGVSATRIECLALVSWKHKDVHAELCGDTLSGPLRGFFLRPRFPTNKQCRHPTFIFQPEGPLLTNVWYRAVAREDTVVVRVAADSTIKARFRCTRSAQLTPLKENFSGLFSNGIHKTANPSKTSKN